MGSFPPRKLLVYIWQECKNCLGGERGSVNSVKFQFCFIYSPLRLQEIALLAFPDNKQKYKGQSWYHDINPCRHQPSRLIQATASPQINYYFFQQDMFIFSLFLPHPGFHNWSNVIWMLPKFLLSSLYWVTTHKLPLMEEDVSLII